MRAIALNGQSFELSSQAVASLGQQLRGQLLGSDDRGYEEARHVYNGMIDKHPSLIARCADVADVTAAVRFARDQDLLLSVRGGGHNGPGLAVCDGGLTIDLSAMRGIRVDPEARSARVEAGCRWQDVDHATHGFGLATVSGIIGSTGVAGLTLGGGHGYLTRKYGLTIDNLTGADVVLSNGEFVQANERQHADLFWALRGGGGNFGVVTSFEYRLHPVRNVIAGPMFWPIDAGERLLRWYRAFMPQAPDDVYAFFVFGCVPPAPPFPEAIQGQQVCGLMWCLLGDAQQAQRALQPIRELEPPLFEAIGEMPYPALQQIFDPLLPPGLQWYWKGDFVRDISDEAIAQHMQHARVPTPLSLMHLYPVDGAAGRVAADDTAWAYRDARWSMVIAGVATDPSQNEAMTSWARSYWQALHPYSAGGAYVNFMMDEGGDRVRATYGEHYARLAAIKAHYDPDNRFRVNQNIAPARS